MICCANAEPAEVLLNYTLWTVVLRTVLCVN
uniref:Uncharacterized protein n=1 Tax=Arundo donax TaxID=35708 RepID=A0A0A8ZEN6_ARUDO